ncbi:MAG: TerB family tellurite resistance protein [Candidatus Hydrogenedentes bacterium]|nr:TerB family tellurite resistance protein [Candidatus Hydrogenedentota bacterium]
MLDKLFKLFAIEDAGAIETDPEEKLRMATCVILLEVAGADNEFSPEECEHIISALRQRFQLSQEDAEELIRVAQERRDESSDLWKFTNQINQACSNDEKIQIIEEVWRLIYADSVLDGHEDYLVHKLARLMNLKHPILIDAKLKVLKEIRGEG